MDTKEDKASLLASGLLVSIGSILPSITGGLLWIVASRILGEDGVGLASSVISASFMAAYLASLGFDMALVRNIKRLGSSALAISLSISLPLSLLLAFAVSQLLTGKIPGTYMLFVYLFTAVYTISFLLLWSLVGLKLSVIYAKIATISSLVKLLLGVALSLYYGPLGVILGFIASSLAAIVLASIILVKSLPLRGVTFSADIILDGLSNYPNVLAGSIAANIGTVLAVMTAETLGDVGVFYLSLTIALLAGSFSYSLAYVAVSHNVREAYNDVTRYALLSAAITAPALASAPKLVYSILGINGDTMIMVVLALSILGYASLYMIISLLNTRGLRARLSIVGLTRVLALIVLSLALSKYGPLGIATAYTISLYISLCASGQWWIIGVTIKSLVGLTMGLAVGYLASDISELISLFVAPMASFAALIAIRFIGIGEIISIAKSIIGLAR